MDESFQVFAEQLTVGKRKVQTARVRVSKRVVVEERSVDVTLRHERVEIERVSVNRVVEQVSPIRQEGDVTIVPVYEEVMVKQLVLKEELRITRRSTEEQRPQPVSLRREEVEVTRTPIADTAVPSRKAGD